MVCVVGRVGLAVLLWAVLCPASVLQSAHAAQRTDLRENGLLGVDRVQNRSLLVTQQVRHVLQSQQALQLQQRGAAAQQAAPPAPAAQAAALLLQPQGGWMGRCCSDKRLQAIYMPGTHDSGTGYPWTVPRHLPLVFDEVAAVLFNIVGHLSRTQHLTVYEQLQAGARVLDIRLAVNPWIPLQQRVQQPLGVASTTSTSSSSRMRQRLRGLLRQGQQQQAEAPAAAAAAAPPSLHSLQGIFKLDTQQLQGRVDYAAAGGPLSAAELASAVVISHSLPGAPLAGVLADVARFLQEQPSEVVTILVKGDTVDVNVAGIQRMSPQAWAAAAGIFRSQLAGVQFLQQQQVEQLTLGEIASGAPAGSVLLYGRELLAQGLPCLLQPRLLESWGNGTNTEELPDLKDKLLQWLQFWQHSSNQGASSSYMLLASAEVTLGVRTILQLLRRRLWTVQQQQGSSSYINSRPQQQHGVIERRRQQQQHGVIERRRQQQQQAAALQQAYDGLRQLGLVRTLYDLGQQTNVEVLRDILQDSQVPKSFNVWSLDALSDSDIINSIISLNMRPT